MNLHNRSIDLLLPGPQEITMCTPARNHYHNITKRTRGLIHRLSLMVDLSRMPPFSLHLRIHRVLCRPPRPTIHNPSLVNEIPIRPLVTLRTVTATNQGRPKEQPKLVTNVELLRQSATKEDRLVLAAGKRIQSVVTETPLRNSKFSQMSMFANH